MGHVLVGDRPTLRVSDSASGLWLCWKLHEILNTYIPKDTAQGLRFIIGSDCNTWNLESGTITSTFYIT